MLKTKHPYTPKTKKKWLTRPKLILLLVAVNIIVGIVFLVLLDSYYQQNVQVNVPDQLEPIAEDQPLITSIDYQDQVNTQTVHVIVSTFKQANVVLRNDTTGISQQSVLATLQGDFQVTLAKGNNAINITAYDDKNSYNRQINIIYDASLPIISLLTPSNVMTETYKANTTVQFKVTNPSAIKNVELNNESITANSNGIYQKQINLQNGLNKITITSLTIDGNTQSIDLTINRTKTMLTKFPILMYHHILEIQKDADYLSPQMFEAQLKFLKDNHFTSVSFQNLNDYLLTGRPIASHGIILSFDDGYLDAYTKAFPLLDKYGFKGSFGIIINAVGNPNMMNWSNLKDLVRSGNEIVSHSYSHRSMRILPDKQLIIELQGSKVILETKLGIKVNTFIYPSGDYSDHVIEELKKFGYESARTTKYGSNISPSTMYTLPTIRISKGTDAEKFALLLKGFTTGSTNN